MPCQRDNGTNLLSVAGRSSDFSTGETFFIGISYNSTIGYTLKVFKYKLKGDCQKILDVHTLPQQFLALSRDRIP